MAASPVKLPRRRIRGIPVLLYHRTGGQEVMGRDKYCVSARELLEQLRFLQRHARVTLVSGVPGFSASSAQTRQNRACQGPLAETTCAVAFDDGRECDFLHAFPLLLETGLNATFFINTAHAGGAGYLSWAQMAEMQKAGMSFQSHGHRHVNFTRLPRATAVSELRLSRELLEQKLGCEATCFAAPYGLVNGKVIRAAHEAGFKIVCTSHNWPAQPGRQVIGRIAVDAGTTLPEFQKLVFGAAGPLLCRTLREAALWTPKWVAQRVWPQRFHEPLPRFESSNRAHAGDPEGQA